LFFEYEPLEAQPLGQAPLPPATSPRWTPPFRFMLALIVLLGAAATLFSTSGTPIGEPFRNSPGAYLDSGHQAQLILNIVSIVVCLVGIRLVGNAFLRAAFLLYLVTNTVAILTSLPVFTIELHLFPALATFFFEVALLALTPLFLLGLGLLSLIAKICLSYGLAGWHPQDRACILVQLFLTFVLGFVLLQSLDFSRFADRPDFLFLEVSTPFLAVASLACLLCRPACWKAHPLLVVCFSIGGVGSLLFDYVIEPHFYFSGTPTLFIQASNVITLLGSTIFILGVLLLIQEQRRKKQAQTSAAC
jgi:hypothetical protein